MVQLGQVEAAGSARDAAALEDALYELVLPQGLSNLPGETVDLVRDFFQLFEDPSQGLGVDAGLPTQPLQHRRMAVELFQDFRLDVCTGGHADDVEQRVDDRACCPLLVLGQEERNAREQMLQA